MSANWPTHGVPSTKECVEGALIVGDVVSTTVTEVAQVVVFPAASVAVKVTLVVPKPIAPPAAGLWVTTTAPAQVSAAEAVEAKSGIKAPQEASPESVCGGAQAVKAGGVTSSTTKLAVQVDVLPAASATVSVMSCDPLARTAPAAGAWVTTREPVAVVLSAATTPDVKSGTSAVQLPASALADWVGPQDEITGGVVSMPVKLVVQLAVLPAASATVTVTVVAPRPTCVPAAGDCVRDVTAQLSAAAVPVAKSGRAIVPLAPTEPVCAEAQAEIVGTRLSWMV
jgi:hypothetical protein